MYRPQQFEVITEMMRAMEDRHITTLETQNVLNAALSFGMSTLFMMALGALVRSFVMEALEEPEEKKVLPVIGAVLPEASRIPMTSDLIFFNVPQAREYLLRRGFVYTLRPKMRKTGRDVAAYGSYYEHQRIGHVWVDFVKEVKDKGELRGYVADSGFKSVEDWWRAAKGSRFLFKVTLTPKLLPATSSPAIMPIQEWHTVASPIPAQRCGRFAIIKRHIKAGSELKMYDVFGYDRCIFLRDEVITVLYEGEKDPATDPKGVWMSDSPYEYYGMWQFASRAKPARVLLGGLGLGILANLLAQRADISFITAVELSPEVIRMVRPYLSPKVRVIPGDFLRVIYNLEASGDQFGTVIADIFKTGEETVLFEDVGVAMEDCYPEAEHLFWAFQERYEAQKLYYWELGRGEKRW